jgi:hypothetical protein
MFEIVLACENDGVYVGPNFPSKNFPFIETLMAMVLAILFSNHMCLSINRSIWRVNWFIRVQLLKGQTNI